MEGYSCKECSCKEYSCKEYSCKGAKGWWCGSSGWVGGWVGVGRESKQGQSRVLCGQRRAAFAAPRGRTPPAPPPPPPLAALFVPTARRLTRFRLQQVLPHVVIHRQVGQKEVRQLLGAALKLPGLRQGSAGERQTQSGGRRAQGRLQTSKVWESALGHRHQTINPPTLWVWCMRRQGGCMHTCKGTTPTRHHLRRDGVEEPPGPPRQLPRVEAAVQRARVPGHALRRLPRHAQRRRLGQHPAHAWAQRTVGRRNKGSMRPAQQGPVGSQHSKPSKDGSCDCMAPFDCFLRPTSNPTPTHPHHPRT